MKSGKMKLIETYVYAKTLNEISKSTAMQSPSKQIADLAKNASNMSKMLLDACEQKINSRKLNNASFLLLKQQLKTLNLPNSPTTNYLKLCEMIKCYNHHLNVVMN